MWNRKQAIAAAPPIETWPRVLAEAIEPASRERHEHLVDAVTRYFKNEPVQRIAALTGVSGNQLPRLARNCLRPSDDGLILGFRALIPYFRIKDYERRAPEKFKFPEALGGNAGLLSQMLRRFPDLEDVLVKHIRQDAKLNQVHEFRLRPRDLHRIFIRLIKEKGVKACEWPFTTKHLGKRSIERFMRQVLDRNFVRAVNTRESQEARAHMSVGTGHEPFLSYDEPYAAVEIDAYKIEAHLSVTLATPEGTETEVALERLWLIAAVDRFSSAILAYRVVYRSEVNAEDVLRVIRDAASKRWEPMALTIPLTYPKGSGLPSGVLPKAYGALWTCTLLDGALAHLSKAVHERARKAVGFAINWGPVAHFERRPNVEKTFDKTAKEIFRRLPSTTGGGPHKGRADSAQQKAVSLHIKACEVEQLLDVTIAQHNILPSEGNSFMSPMETLSYFFDGSPQSFLVRKSPHHPNDCARKFRLHEVHKVRGGAGTGRRPYIQLDRAHYTSPVLENAGHLIGKLLTVEIDEDDYRQVNAFLPNGAEIGVLKVKGRWARSKHSRRTRKLINALVSKRILVLSELDDPIQVYMRHLAQNRTGKKKGTITPRQATQLTQLAKEAGHAPRIPSPQLVPSPRPFQPKLVSMADSNLSDKFFTKVRNRR